MPLYRPIPLSDPADSPAQNGAPQSLPLAGGARRFARVEVLERGRAPVILPVSEIPDHARDLLTRPRAPIPGLRHDRPAVMGIVNVTPDSFSDGGRFFGAEAAFEQAQTLIAEGADILDIGGESTRPGAATVPDTDEIARIAPLIAALRAAGVQLPVSVDTRKAAVATNALSAGADLVNDVSALSFDPQLAAVVARAQVPVCLMHAQGDPATMQDDPRYDDVVLDVYEYLESRVNAAVAAGIPRDRILVDPGIGFGKTVAHNLALIARISVFHGLGCPILLGASRKRFIGTVADEPVADRRLPGSLAVALAAAAQGVQVIRVHDVAATHQALALWRALDGNAWAKP